jgi:hypothetical protein
VLPYKSNGQHEHPTELQHDEGDHRAMPWESVIPLLGREVEDAEEGIASPKNVAPRMMHDFCDAAGTDLS